MIRFQLGALFLALTFIITGCAKDFGRVEVYHNNLSNFGVEFEEFEFDGDFRLGRPGASCGADNTTGQSIGRVDTPSKIVTAKWYSYKTKRNFKASIKLPEINLLKSIYFSPPWSDFDKNIPMGS